jgi:AcrR family transcriptional regulator
MALAAARKIGESEGLRGLTARRVAGKIGCSVGTLYNLFDNLDDLIVQLNGTTLHALYDALAAAPAAKKPDAALRTLARTYIRFTRDHPNLWNILFEHRLPEGQSLPDWYHGKVKRLLGLVEEALAPLFTPRQEKQRFQAARVLWCGLHGICSLASTGKLGVVTSESVEAMADSLVANYVAGLRDRVSRFTSSPTAT